MKKKHLLLALSSAALLGGALASCASSANADVTLVVYNWEDYIDEGVDEYGDPRIEEDGSEAQSTVAMFEEYYKKETGKSIHVDYETFATCEQMYNEIKVGSISPDLCCPSDYMIQRMAREGMLESFGFDSATHEYASGLDQFNTYGSPYIRDLFEKNGFSDYAVPYFWGTMGVTYNPEKVEESDTETWDILWNSNYKNRITVKDSVRDTYFTAVMHVYHDELMNLKGQHDAKAITDEAYNESLSEIFNRVDDATLASCKNALIALKDTIKGLEVDDGKNDIIDGKIDINLAWSGDSVYSMDEAENSDVYLNYAVPEEGSNVWFDGWCMPKGANVEASKMFLNFLSRPDIAAKNMDVTGYTSPIAGQDILDLCNDWYACDDDETEYDEVDLSYFFGDTIEEGETAVVRVAKEDRGRQFDAQFPSEDVITRCAVMKDFGDRTSALASMWQDVKASLS